ncbi:MAG: hypothetical protein ACPH5V_07275, partial [Alcanivorax sp.]
RKDWLESGEGSTGETYQEALNTYQEDLNAEGVASVFWRYLLSEERHNRQVKNPIDFELSGDINQSYKDSLRYSSAESRRELPTEKFVDLALQAGKVRGYILGVLETYARTNPELTSCLKEMSEDEIFGFFLQSVKLRRLSEPEETRYIPTNSQVYISMSAGCLFLQSQRKGSNEN